MKKRKRKPILNTNLADCYKELTECLMNMEILGVRLLIHEEVVVPNDAPPYKMVSLSLIDDNDGKVVDVVSSHDHGQDDTPLVESQTSSFDCHALGYLNAYLFGKDANDHNLDRTLRDLLQYEDDLVRFVEANPYRSPENTEEE